MKRREFSLAACSALAAAALPLSSAQAQMRKPVDGTDYISLNTRVQVDAPPGKVEVMEFFSYNCPHCAEFEPRLEAWLKQLPSYVVFKRVPVPFVGGDPEVKQRMYYALDAMGKAETTASRVFHAIHEEHVSMTGDAAVLAWVQRQPGLDAKQFADLFSSFTVQGKARRASQLTDAFKVQGVPALGIGGRYYTDGMAGSMERALQVTDFLITEIHAGR